MALIDLQPATLIESSSERAGTRYPWVWPTLCCLALLTAILLANPFSEAGFEDDWSYGHVAMRLAQTGRLQYNGWGGSLLLFQVFWAFPWIGIFGFSFQVLQASTIPVSLGTVLLIYPTGRRLGLSRQLAAFAAIGTALCPLLLPFAASFMTESYACFFSMLCVYCALRTIQAGTSRTALRWLWALAAAGLAGGANRQIVWAAGLALIPWLAWQRRAESRFVFHAVASLAVCGVAVVTILRFLSQPYGALHVGQTSLISLALHRWPHPAFTLIRLLLAAVLMAVPAFTCLWARVPRWVIPAALALAIVGIYKGWPLAPYGESIVTASGIALTMQDSGAAPSGRCHRGPAFSLQPL